jgi:amidase
MTGSPTITLPAGFSPRGTPLGVQFIGRDFSEHLLLQAGHAFQCVTDFHTKHPPLAQKARQLERAVL